MQTLLQNPMPVESNTGQPGLCTVLRIAITRRGVLKLLAAAAGAAAIPAAAQSSVTAQARADAAVRLLGWLELGEDGSVTLFHTTTEIGQGTPSTLAQIVADQLDVPWSAMRLAQAPMVSPFFEDGGYYGTSSSSGLRSQFDELQQLGAAARQLLVETAAAAWQVAAAACETAAGEVVHPATGRRVRYAALAGAATTRPLPANQNIVLRSGGLLGVASPPLGVAERVRGSAKFGIDVVLADMAVATIAQAPTAGAVLVAQDRRAALRWRGVLDVVELPDAVAVVARDTWSALQGLKALDPKWRLPAAAPSSAAWRKTLRSALDGDAGVLVAAFDASTPPQEQRRRARAALAAADKTISAQYETPFAAHQTMEPQNATARVGATSAELWVPTQHQSLVQQSVGKALDLPAAAVTVHTTAVGGGFGRRLEVDVPVQAALIARRLGRPVKLIWSREQDVRHDYFRPAAAARLQAALAPGGRVNAWMIDLACPSILASSGNTHEPEQAGVDFTALMGLGVPYDLPKPSVRWTPVPAPVRVGWWRSVGSSNNCFFVESFVDEIAAELGLSPLAYRRRLLPAGSRARHVLETLASNAQLDGPAPAGRSRGLAMIRMSDSIAAESVEISISDGRVTVHEVHVAFDCGRAINPSAVRAQVQGSVLWGLSACLLEEITFERGAVVQSNFHDYPVARMQQAPRITVHLVDSGATLGGAGEEAVPPIAPALAGALHAATGRRLRELPFARAGLGWA
jgi:isoquinoline 1-oxidoreductase beta subunit